MNKGLVNNFTIKRITDIETGGTIFCVILTPMIPAPFIIFAPALPVSLNSTLISYLFYCRLHQHMVLVLQHLFLLMYLLLFTPSFLCVVIIIIIIIIIIK